MVAAPVDPRLAAVLAGVSGWANDSMAMSCIAGAPKGIDGAAAARARAMAGAEGMDGAAPGRNAASCDSGEISNVRPGIGARRSSAAAATSHQIVLRVEGASDGRSRQTSQAAATISAMATEAQAR